MRRLARLTDLAPAAEAGVGQAAARPARASAASWRSRRSDWRTTGPSQSRPSAARSASWPRLVLRTELVTGSRSSMRRRNRPPDGPGEQPGEQRGAQVPEVQGPGGARREPSDGHGQDILRPLAGSVGDLALPPARRSRMIKGMPMTRRRARDAGRVPGSPGPRPHRAGRGVRGANDEVGHRPTHADRCRRHRWSGAHHRAAWGARPTGPRRRRRPDRHAHGRRRRRHLRRGRRR